MFGNMEVCIIFPTSEFMHKGLCKGREQRSIIVISVESFTLKHSRVRKARSW